ncbi:MAG: hypothetical protein HKO64_09740 [Xanthomonadales bacterium]|nr:hypothetical protein [Xanthomonadales bacterium]
MMNTIYGPLSILVLCLAIGTRSALAGAIFYSGEFTGDEGKKVSGVNCEPQVAIPYIEAGEFTVSRSGDYAVSDAVEIPSGWLDLVGTVDIQVMVFEKPGVIGLNKLIACVETYGMVALNSSKTYILGVHLVGNAAVGTFAMTLDGPGEITGVGSEIPGSLRGGFNAQSPTAYFDIWDAEVAYQVIGPLNVSQDGYYLVNSVPRAHQELDNGFFITSRPGLLVYQDDFDVADQAKNLMTSNLSRYYLQAGRDYYLVAITDEIDNNQHWHAVVLPPKTPPFNQWVGGAWVSPGVNNQGLLMEFAEQTGIAFLTWFTFETAGSGSQSSALESLGSQDQRWLTAFGALSADKFEIPLNFENTTGGRFLGTDAIPNTDSNYGTGSLEIVDCDHLVLNYDLPGVEAASLDYHRAMPLDRTGNCYTRGKLAPMTSASLQPK